MRWGNRRSLGSAAVNRHSQSRAVFGNFLMIGARLAPGGLVLLNGAHFQHFHPLHPFLLVYFSYLVFSPAIFYLLISIFLLFFVIFFSRIGLSSSINQSLSRFHFIVVIFCSQNKLHNGLRWLSLVFSSNSFFLLPSLSWYVRKAPRRRQSLLSPQYLRILRMCRLPPVRWRGGTKPGMLLLSDLGQPVSSVRSPSFPSLELCLRSQSLPSILSSPSTMGFALY